jgi:hypothetical protein
LASGGCVSGDESLLGFLAYTAERRGVLRPARFCASASPTSERQLPIDSGDGSPEADHLGTGQELLPDGAVIFPVPDGCQEGRPGEVEASGEPLCLALGVAVVFAESELIDLEEPTWAVTADEVCRLVMQVAFLANRAVCVVHDDEGGAVVAAADRRPALGILAGQLADVGGRPPWHEPGCGDDGVEAPEEEPGRKARVSRQAGSGTDLARLVLRPGLIPALHRYSLFAGGSRLAAAW